MKTLLAAVLVLTSVGAMAQNKPAAPTKPVATSYTLDKSESKVAWVGKKVTGQHNGNLKIKSGTLTVLGDVLTGGEIVVDIDSLTVADITASDDAGKFVGHMKSADFFDTQVHPEAKLVIKSSKKTKKGLEIKGDLTIKGVTKPETFLATVVNEGDKLVGKADLKIDRTKYGLKYGSTNFFKGLGDKAIHNDFNLTVDIVALK